MRRHGRLGLLLLATSLSPLKVALAQVSVTFLEDTVWLGVEGPERVPLLLDNVDSSPATIRIVAVHPSNALALTKADPPREIPGRSSDTIAVALSPVPGGRLVSRAYLVFEVRRGKAPRYVRSGPLAVRWRGYEPLDELVKAELVASAAAVSTSRPSDLFLMLTNVAPVTVHLGYPTVRLSSPGLTPAVDSAELAPLAPGETRAIRIKVSVKGDVSPGKYVAAVELPIGSMAGRSRTNHLVRTQTIEVGIAGESAMLQLLGVPSFLLLPGFLALTAFNALRRRRVFLPGPASAGTQVEWTQPEFWLIAISLSIAAAILYPLLPGHRNYLVAYGASDVLIVWTGAILVGGAAYLLLVAVLRWRQRRRAAWKAAHTLSTRDTELDALDKLGRLGLSIKQPMFNLDGKGNSEQVWTADGGKPLKPDQDVLVFPVIECVLADRSGPEFSAFTARLRRDLDDASAAEVARDLREGLEKGWLLKVDFAPGSFLGGHGGMAVGKDLHFLGQDRVVQIP